MKRVKVIVQPVVGDPLEEEIELAEGDVLIFRMNFQASRSEVQETMKRIRALLRGEADFMLIDPSISILRIGKGKVEAQDGPETD